MKKKTSRKGRKGAKYAKGTGRVIVFEIIVNRMNLEVQR